MQRTGTQQKIDIALLKERIETIRANDLEHIKQDIKEIDKKNDEAHLHFSAQLENLSNKVESVKDELQRFLAKVGAITGLVVIAIEIIINYLHR